MTATAYWRDGFVSNLSALTRDEVGAFFAEFAAYDSTERERHGPSFVPDDYFPRKDPPHRLHDWFVRLATHPRVLDAVANVIGDNILIRNGDVFVKLPGRVETLSWHQDSAMADVDGMVTAWIALTDATRANGCIEFSRGTHRRELTRPTSKYDLTLPDAGIAALRLEDCFFNEMPAGHMSLHHLHTVHCSPANDTSEIRVAYAIRYMAAGSSREAAESGEGYLARGENVGRGFSARPHFPVTWNYGIGRKPAATE